MSFSSFGLTNRFVFVQRHFWFVMFFVFMTSFITDNVATARERETQQIVCALLIARAISASRKSVNNLLSLSFSNYSYNHVARFMNASVLFETSLAGRSVVAWRTHGCGF